MKILVTGNAGFIGSHVVRALLERGDEVVGYDNLNDYYDPALKRARLAFQEKIAREGKHAYEFIRADLTDRGKLEHCFTRHKFDRAINLAAQAGVRYSLANPHAYIDSNIVGFANLLEACRQAEIAHFVYASTSSVYGANETMPLSEHHGADHPLQIYAATKRANELMAHAYSHLYRLPTTGLRFFTVYGPWGRPDMAPSLFARAILEGKAIDVFNHGQHARDFTFVDDIIEGTLRVADKIATPAANWDGAQPDPATSNAPFRIFNLGNSNPVALDKFIAAIEQALGKTAKRNLLPMQPGDVPSTWADIDELERWIGYRPQTSIEAGMAQFISWYKRYYEIT